jgi:hypothetical protein
VVDVASKKISPAEEIEAMASNGKAGIKATQEIMAQKEKEEKEIKAIEEDILKTSRVRVITYTSTLARMLIKRLNQVAWQGWTYKVAHTEKGVVLELYSPSKKIYRSAFKATGDPMFDLNAIDVFADRCENTIEKNSPHVGKKIWTPKTN